MSTLITLTRMTGLAFALGAGAVLAATPGEAAKRQKVYVNKGAPTYGDFRTPAGPRRMIIRDRINGPRWGYIGPHYESRFGPGYHTNGPGIGIEK
ncbi:MAG: hypothetical protein WBW51_00240 [Methyloceanibacter sp.]